MGVTIRPDQGGAGRDYVSYALAIEALATASAVVAVIAAVNNSLVAEPLAQFGSDVQRERWLRPLASGEALGAFAPRKNTPDWMPPIRRPSPASTRTAM